MEANNVEEEKSRPVKLETEVKNSIRHTFEALQETNGRNSVAGEVAKSKLQVLCATTCRDVGIPYSAEDLNVGFKEEKKSLSCAEFVEYLEELLLPKGNGNLGVEKLNQLYWSIVRQAFYKQEDHTLTEDDAYKQWLIFNTLDIDETSRVHKEELGLLLEKVSHAIGKIWNPSPLNDCCEVEELTFWQYLECLEKHYLAGTTRSIFQEALEEIVDFVVNEILMQGYLIKKGHMVRSVKNRWFVLKPGILAYYTNRTCTDKKGEIVINHDTKVAAIPDSKKYRFSVTCGRSKTNYDLEARDQRTKQEWLVTLQKAIENSGGQSVQRKERLQRRLDRNDKRIAKLEEERRKREQENLVLAQQKELELLRQKYSDAEAQALLEAENLQEEVRRREELEKLHLELQQLLLTEKEAREAEAKARALQEELLLNEKKRLEEMEKMKAEKEKMLQDELKMRESLEERQKLQDQLLLEERTRLEALEKERQAAEEAMREANEKLEAAQEASRKAAEEAKKKAREIKTCTGLARPVGPHNPAFITHRGIGAFCEGDFEKIKNRQKIPPSVLPKPKRPTANGDRETENEVKNNGHSEENEKENDVSMNGDVEVEVESENTINFEKQDESSEKDQELQKEMYFEPVNNVDESAKINEQESEMPSNDVIHEGGENKENDYNEKPEDQETSENSEEEQDTQANQVKQQGEATENLEKEQDTQASEVKQQEQNPENLEEMQDTQDNEEKQQEETTENLEEQNAQSSKESESKPDEVEDAMLQTNETLASSDAAKNDVATEKLKDDGSPKQTEEYTKAAEFDANVAE